MTRLEANLKILEKLKTYLEKYPDLRFCQALSSLDLDKDNFYQESVVTLWNINEIMEK